ncbi:hypothetical protein [Pseudogemmobacter humi]|uniref:Uncharacterized protein n=1 Tax=Pseudogemmobacter humi TaxID=2483812 RepID=A0A3P5WEC6_9RHOB|nr:hypothetical protein [Pseudogemmobacter humi]VDC18864.1 hypothetical protein XINFAN_00006 [Pseudogemmobacter humi]
MLIVLCAIAVLAELLAGLLVLGTGGGWLAAFVAAQAAGCAAVAGAAAIANAPQRIRRHGVRTGRRLTNHT